MFALAIGAGAGAALAAFSSRSPSACARRARPRLGAAAVDLAGYVLSAGFWLGAAAGMAQRQEAPDADWDWAGP